MPFETLAPETSESAEIDTIPVSANEFCKAYIDISRLMRMQLGATLKVSPEKLTPGHVASHYGTVDRAVLLLDTLDQVFGLPEMREAVESYGRRHSDANVVMSPGMVGQIYEFSRVGILGAFANSIMTNHPEMKGGSEKRILKSRSIEARQMLVDLVDGDFGRQAGFTRTHLRALVQIGYGEASRDADSYESGISTEIATKRYLESLIGSENVRYASINEDLKGGDIVISKAHKTLYADVKSSDKNEVDTHDMRAHHSRIEEVDVGVYRVKQLHPATPQSIGNDFSIVAESYKNELQAVLLELDNL